MFRWLSGGLIGFKMWLKCLSMHCQFSYFFLSNVIVTHCRSVWSYRSHLSSFSLKKKMHLLIWQWTHALTHIYKSSFGWDGSVIPTSISLTFGWIKMIVSFYHINYEVSIFSLMKSEWRCVCGINSPCPLVPLWIPSFPAGKNKWPALNPFITDSWTLFTPS